MLEPFNAAAVVQFDVEALACEFRDQADGDGRIDLDANAPSGQPLAAEDRSITEKRLDVRVMRRYLVDDPLVDAGAGLAAWVWHAGMVAESSVAVKRQLAETRKSARRKPV